MIILTIVLSFVAQIAIIRGDKRIVSHYSQIQFVCTLVCLFSILMFIYRWAQFAGASLVGLSTYYENEWPNLLRYVHYKEFKDDGMSSCPGGKYFEQTEIKNDYRQVDCQSAVKDYPNLQDKAH